MADIFISYSRVYQAATLELAGALWAEGYTTWTDTSLLSDQTLFQQVIDAQVDAAKAVITIWSTPAKTSRWVNYESKRGLKQDKLICTHMPDFDPDDMPADFHGLHCAPVGDIATIVNSLVSKGVYPEGKSEKDLPPEAVLERQALKEWRAGMESSEDPEALAAFIKKYYRARMVRLVAEQRLQVVKAKIEARKRGQDSAKAIALFDTLQDGAEPEEYVFFLKKYATAQPELAAVIAERLADAAPEMLLALPESLGAWPVARERAAAAIRLRNTPMEAAILRIEAGMHTAAIRRISVTRDGRMLATGSDDKTVRLWSLPDGKLLRVLRGAIGDGDDGKVYAVAMDPLGQWVAAGGWTQSVAHFVTIFDALSGRILQRMGPLPNVVAHLAISEDGSSLAAGVGAGGIWVWRRDGNTWRKAWDDKNYGEIVCGVAFSPSGENACLATTSYDGHVRLYGVNAKLHRKIKAPGGKLPYGVSFSPDGGRLAIGYEDAAKVDWLDVPTLTQQARPVLSGVNNGNLSSVAVLNDGTLVSGGTYDENGQSPILAWRGTRLSWPGSRITIMDLTKLADGGVAFGAADPAFGTLSSTGQRILYRRPANADLRNARGDAFTVSGTGVQVRFGLNTSGRLPHLFDLTAGVLVPSANKPEGLRQPETSTLDVKGWKDTYTPTFNGKALPLQNLERSRALAIAPGGKQFALGTEWWLHGFAVTSFFGLFKSVKTKWSQPVPSVCWGVNWSADGRVIVAAYGDGTIRWHRPSDGAEVLALFVLVEDGKAKDWVCWTPKGYFMASPGGETLIGWHVNRGADQAADFYPAQTFAETFRRPDIVKAALDTL